jgi:hypothetical protein
MFELSRSGQVRLGQLSAAHPGFIARMRLFGLLALLVPLFVGLQGLVREGVPRVEIRFVSQDVPVPVSVPVEVPVERVVERIVYVPVDRSAPGVETSQSPLERLTAAGPTAEALGAAATSDEDVDAAATAEPAAPVEAATVAAPYTVPSFARAPVISIAAPEEEEAVEDVGVPEEAPTSPPEVVASSVGASLASASGEIHQAAVGVSRSQPIVPAPVRAAPPVEDEADAPAAAEPPDDAVVDDSAAATKTPDAEAATPEDANHGGGGVAAAVPDQANDAADEAPAAPATAEQSSEETAEGEQPSTPVFADVAANLGYATAAVGFHPASATESAEAAPTDEQAVADGQAAAEQTPDEQAVAAEQSPADDQPESAATTVADAQPDDQVSDEQASMASATNPDVAPVDGADAGAVAEDRHDDAPSDDAAVAARPEDADDDQQVGADQDAGAPDDVRADAPHQADAPAPVSNTPDTIFIDPQS